MTYRTTSPKARECFVTQTTKAYKLLDDIGNILTEYVQQVDADAVRWDHVGDAIGLVSTLQEAYDAFVWKDTPCGS